MNRHDGPRPRRQRGAALLLAMLILTLVSTLAAGMVWQQWRAIQVEAAERARGQAGWILTGALDWARLILREDARSTKKVDHLGEPWAVPLAEARLSTFLAADANHADDNDGPEAFLSGLITDAQSRYNLRNLVPADAVDPRQLQVLTRLCASAGLSIDVANRIANGLRDAWVPGADNAAVAPENVSQLAWLGIDAASIDKLRPWVEILPVSGTKVNLNTAPREVLAAVIDGLDLGGAERLVDARQRNPFDTVAEAQLPQAVQGQPNPADGVDTITSYFEVQGRLRLGDRILEERSLVRRDGLQITLLQRERLSRSSAQLAP